MKTATILLSTINDVKSFVNIVSKYDFDVDLTSGRYALGKGLSVGLPPSPSKDA